MAVRQRKRIRSSARRDLIALRQAKRELKATAMSHAQVVKTEFEDIVSDWSPKNQPRFLIQLTINDREIRAIVRPHKRRKASTIFHWTDKGTRPHVIRPKRSNKTGRLAFRLGYNPKTLPIAQAHVGDGQATGEWRTPVEVQHPGTKARLFSETIQKRTYQRFRSDIENTFRRLQRRMR